MRLAFDTNILAYAEGLGDEARCQAAVRMIARVSTADGVIAAQTLGELARVLSSKAKRSPAQARETVLSWADSFEVVDSSWSAFKAALDLTVDHQLPMWDALILAVAAEAGCRVLLSEDFQHGFTWRGVTVVNPFLEPVPPLLQSVLGGPG